MGNVRAALGRPAQAEAAFREAIELEPDNEEALFNLAVTIRERDVPQAITLLSQATKADPEFAAAYRELSWTLLEQGDLRGATEAIGAALHLDENDARAHVYAAHLLLRSGRSDDALLQLERAHALSPLWSLPLILKGRLLEDSGNAERAELVFRTAVELNPEDPDSLAELGRHLATRNRIEAAVVFLTHALQRDPSHAVAFQANARIAST